MKRLTASVVLAAVLCLSSAAWSAGAGEGPAPAASEAAPCAGLASGHGRVAYWERAGDHWELFLADGDRREACLVYRAAAAPGETCVGRAMAWSPDGAGLVFSAPAGEQGEVTRLFMVRQDGSGLRCVTSLTRCAADPCWSPDGRAIAFLQATAGEGPREWSVWTMRADGSGRQQAAAVGPTVTGPGAPLLRWSEDGSRVEWPGASALSLGLKGN